MNLQAQDTTKVNNLLKHKWEIGGDVPAFIFGNSYVTIYAKKHHLKKNGKTGAYRLFLSPRLSKTNSESSGNVITENQTVGLNTQIGYEWHYQYNNRLQMYYAISGYCNFSFKERSVFIKTATAKNKQEGVTNNDYLLGGEFIIGTKYYVTPRFLLSLELGYGMSYSNNFQESLTNNNSPNLYRTTLSTDFVGGDFGNRLLLSFLF